VEAEHVEHKSNQYVALSWLALAWMQLSSLSWLHCNLQREQKPSSCVLAVGAGSTSILLDRVI
jgi:hypothetical protein